ESGQKVREKGGQESFQESRQKVGEQGREKVGEEVREKSREKSRQEIPASLTASVISGRLVRLPGSSASAFFPHRRTASLDRPEHPVGISLGRLRRFACNPGPPPAPSRSRGHRDDLHHPQGTLVAGPRGARRAWLLFFRHRRSILLAGPPSRNSCAPDKS